MNRAGQLAVIGGIGAALLAAGCSSSGSSTSASGPASSAAASSSASVPSICGEASSVITSLKKLEHLSVSTSSVSRLTADLQNVKNSVTALNSNAGSQWHAQTSDLKSALQGLQGAVTKLTKTPSVSAISEVKTEASKVVTAGSKLEATAKANCKT